jgi:cytochrome c peroxidase
MRSDFLRRIRFDRLTKGPILVLLLILFVGGLFLYPALDDGFRWREETAYGNPDVLLANYQKWQSNLKARGDEGKLVLALGPIRGLTKQYLQARGSLSLNLFDGTITAEVEGLPVGELFDVWLVNNSPGAGKSFKPEKGDTMLRVGQLKIDGSQLKLRARLDQEKLSGFSLDLAVVTAAGVSPDAGAFLFGSPDLFQRLYYSSPQSQLVKLGAREDRANHNFLNAVSMPFRTLIPRPAYAAESGQAALANLVRLGEQLFFQETFKGNGRTCGTCHPAENNFTLDPAFIATLPPKNPLFVAEFIDALNSDKNGGNRFEIPALMRKQALILENVDGFDDLANKFVMRAIPHTLAMNISLVPAPDGTTVPPVQRTGWSGDGAPADGSLRSFAIGAVTQHFTKTLDRKADVDFVLPTNAQLDAMEAFQLSLGRNQELSLPLDFKPHLAEVDAGQNLFLNTNVGKCSSCHENAGANLTIPNVGTFNFNFDTGVEAFLRNPTRGFSLSLRPIDGGFGRTANSDGSFGNGTFNTPVLVEAADTPPFFHNHIANTIEEATAFYTSAEFTASPSGQFLGPITLSNIQIQQIAAFLRAINALENIRSVIATGRKAIRLPQQAKSLLGVAIADCQDAINVLRRRDAKLPPIDTLAIAHLVAAKELLQKARGTSGILPRDALVRLAIQFMEAAKGRLVD